MEFRRTTLSRGLLLSSRPVDHLKVCWHGAPVSSRQAAGLRRPLLDKKVR